MQSFGAPGGDSLIDRPAAYALVRAPEGVALVLARGGKYFLPGGGIEIGESPLDAVARELVEECRILAAPVCVEAEAVQFFTAASTAEHYRSHMSFVRCEFLGRQAGQGEHATRYVCELPSASSFVHEAHFWALARLLGG